MHHADTAVIGAGPSGGWIANEGSVAALHTRARAWWRPGGREGAGRTDWQLSGLQQAGQVVLRYVDRHGKPGDFPVNPNGSQGDVAGLCDATGRVLGLMPHPERHVLPTQHPRWTREGLKKEGDGLQLFRNAVQFFH